MGQASTKNVSQSVTTALLGVVNQTTQSCVSPVNMNQVISIEGKTVNITGSNISQNQVYSVDFNCLQSNKTVNDLQSSLNQTAQQVAASTNQALNLNPGSTESTNVNNYVSNISESILNAYTGECSTSVQQQQFTNIKAKGTVNITNATLNQSQTGDLMVSCIQNSDNYTQAVSNLQQAVGQTATATVQPLFNFSFVWIVAAIIALVIIIAIISFLIIVLGRRSSKNSEKAAQQLMKNMSASQSAVAGP